MKGQFEPKKTATRGDGSFAKPKVEIRSLWPLWPIANKDLANRGKALHPIHVSEK